MAVRVKVEGLDRAIQKSRRLKGEVKRAVVQQIHDDVKSMATQARAQSFAYGRLQAKAGETIHALIGPDGAAIFGGGGSGLPGKLFYGAEFGGRKRRKTHHGRRGDTYYLIKRRRTTMMFLSHLGRMGYFFFPAIRNVHVGQKERIRAAMVKGGRRA